MYKIIYTNAAINDITKNINYLESEWSDKEVAIFLEKIDFVVALLLAGNVIFISTQYKNVYKIQIVKQITLYYEIKDDKINLLRFWNNYQNPENLILYN